MRHALIALLLAGCAHRFAVPDVRWGEMAPIPVVQPTNDLRRWYVPLESEAVGPHLLFVDTGYSRTTCDDDFVEKLGLQTRGRVRVRGELGRARVTTARLPPIVVGGHVVEGLVCHVRDLHTTSSIHDPREVPVAGVLGSDVLRRFHVVVDPSRARIELHDPRAAPDLPDDGDGVVRLRRELGGSRPKLPLVVEDHVVWPIVDTGASATHLDAQRLGLDPDRQRDNVMVHGTGGAGSDVRTLHYYDVDLALGGFGVGEVTITGRRRGPLAPGLLGLDVLGRFRQEYDFDDRRARFTPVEPIDPPSWFAWTRRPPTPGVEPLRLASPE